MRATIQDANILKTIEPQNFTVYLESKGWHKQRENGDIYSIWNIQLEDEVELLLPLKPNFRDYPQLVFEALKVLELIENRSQLDIFKDLKNILSDVIQIRVDNPNIVNGNIPIYEGVKLFEAARKLMYSAASATIYRKPRFSGILSDVKNYMNKILIGQTEPGSYIVNIISPIGQSEESSFKRRVSQTLFQSLNYLTFPENSRENFLEGAIQEGISANLCDAVLSIGDFIGEQGIDFNLRWSKLINFPSDVPSHVIVTTQALPAIENVKQRLKTKNITSYTRKITQETIQIPVQDEQYDNSSLMKLDEIEGLVTELKWSGGNDIPKVTLKIGEEDEKREIIVELNKSDYFKAISANLSQRLVLCYGRLVQEDDKWILKETRHLSVRSENE
jgi:hypothetical protein